MVYIYIYIYIYILLSVAIFKMTVVESMLGKPLTELLQDIRFGDIGVVLSL